MTLAVTRFVRVSMRCSAPGRYVVTQSTPGAGAIQSGAESTLMRAATGSRSSGWLTLRGGSGATREGCDAAGQVTTPTSSTAASAERGVDIIG